MIKSSHGKRIRVVRVGCVPYKFVVLSPPWPQLRDVVRDADGVEWTVDSIKDVEIIAVLPKKEQKEASV